MGGRRPGGQRRPPPSPDIYDYLHFLLTSGQHDRLRQILERQRDLAEDLRLGRFPLLRRVEAGELDIDGATPLSPVKVNTHWILWNNRTVARIADGIYRSRNFIDLPILGDSLLDASCDIEAMIRHAQARVEHTHRRKPGRVELPGLMVWIAG